MTILVTNPFDHPVELRSNCGNSVQVGPRATRQKVSKVFKWQVPDRVIVEDGPEAEVDPCATVRGQPVVPLMRPPRTAAEAKKVELQGMHPHQTPAERANMRERARKELDSQKVKPSFASDRGSTSTAALSTSNAVQPPDQPFTIERDGDEKKQPDTETASGQAPENPRDPALDHDESDHTNT